MAEWVFSEANFEITAISPSGFKLVFKKPQDLIVFLAKLSQRVVRLTMPDASRLDIDGKGNVMMIDCDPWINPATNTGDVIGSAHEIAACIARYLVDKWPT